MPHDLAQTIALVTGASRGAGRAIALALAERGATVYVTGRSHRGAPTTESLPGTVDDTAADATSLDGKGIAVACDHTRDADVDALFDRIARESGRLDLLVNNAWGGYEAYDLARFTAPFWEQPAVERWRAMFESGVRAMLMASAHAARLMVPRRHGLIVSTCFWDRDRYLGNLFYDVAKSAIVRATAGMAREMREHGVAAVALAPGFMRTERVMAEYAKQPFDLARTESPTYVARAVASLAGDADVIRWSGQVLAVGDLAPMYGFTDDDGRQPPPFHMDE